MKLRFLFEFAAQTIFDIGIFLSDGKLQLELFRFLSLMPKANELSLSTRYSRGEQVCMFWCSSHFLTGDVPNLT